ncbi:MAG: putative quinol monooxygenase [Vulcanimicrobiaceae bacterium]|jgi:quinol monooxygenase YgiN
MLINAVTYTFPAARADEAERLFSELAVASRAEAGCSGYLVARGIADPTMFVLYETWADQAALDLHYQTEHFQRLGVNGIRPIAASRVAMLGAPVAS